MNFRVLFSALLAAGILAACSGHNATSTLPAAPASDHTASVSTSNGVTTISGPIVAIKSSTEFQVQGGAGCGYVNIITNSSTTFSPSGAKPAVGENSVSTGTGSCATSLTASSVTLSGPTPTPKPSATPSPLPASATIGSGEIFGVENQFSPNDGNTSTGGQGQTVDSVFPCKGTMPNTYHVHAFVGILVNGQHVALPDGIGMKNPGADGTFAGIPNWTEYASCYYYMHTHDASGVLHIESNISAGQGTSLYNLGQAFDIWGRPLSTTQVGPYSGTVRAYVAQVAVKTEQIPRSAYTLYTGNPRSIPLKSHTTVWLEIGPTYVAPSGLPVLNYYEEY